MNYLIAGNDQYIKDNEENKIRNKFLSPGEFALNYSVYSPDDMENIMSSLETLPFLSDKRVIHIRDFHLMQEEQIESLVSYFEKGEYLNVLIMSADASFRKTRAFKKISAFVNVIKADVPDEDTLRTWITGFFKRENVAIDRDAVNLLIELKGTDTALIKMELEKLLQFSNGEAITPDHVIDIVGRSVRETVFALVDAINDGSVDETFKILNDLYAQKKQSPEILGYLGWYIRIIQRIKFLQLEGSNESRIASDLGYSVYYVRRLAGQAKRYSYKKVKSWITGLYNADLSIKTGKKDPFLALEMLLVEFLAA